MALEGSRNALVMLFSVLIDIVPLCQLEPECQGEIELCVYFLVFTEKAHNNLQHPWGWITFNIVDV